MSFNPTKQAQKIIFSWKTSNRNHPGLIFNNDIVNLTAIHKKKLGMILESKLSCDKHLQLALSKISKTIGLLRNYQSILPRTC